MPFGAFIEIYNITAAFRALVEENVKANVYKISKSRVMVDVS